MKNETNDSDLKMDRNKVALIKNAEGFFQSLKKFFVELLDFRADTDRDNTMSAIRLISRLKGQRPGF